MFVVCCLSIKLPGLLLRPKISLKRQQNANKGGSQSLSYLCINLHWFVPHISLIKFLIILFVQVVLLNKENTVGLPHAIYTCPNICLSVWTLIKPAESKYKIKKIWQKRCRLQNIWFVKEMVQMYCMRVLLVEVTS